MTDIINAVLKKQLGDSPLADNLPDEDSKKREGMFFAVRELVDAACDLYCMGDMEWDETMGYLADGINNLEGQEKKLQKAYDDDVDKEGEENVEDAVESEE